MVRWAVLALALLLVACPDRGIGNSEAVSKEPTHESNAFPSENGRSDSSPSASVRSTPRAPSEQLVRLRASHPLGVPVHPRAHDSRVSSRAPDGADARIVDETEDGKWLRIRWGQSSEGWISRRYVAKERIENRGQTVAKRAEPPGLVGAGSPWASPEACRKHLRDRRAGRAPRLGTWNLRWYPDGKPGKKAPAGSEGTDLTWLACAIAALDVDVLAVQEMKTLPRARWSTERLLKELDRLTDGRWKAAFDDCPSEASQHVGFLWNAARVRAGTPKTIAALNPHGKPCQDQLRPGLAVEFRFDGEQRFHVVSVHFKSGSNRRSHELRRQSFEAIGRAIADVRTDGASEVIFAGDFNAMGCVRCSPRLEARAEQEEFAAILSRSGAKWVPSDATCSEYYRGEGSLLDRFAGTAGVMGRLSGPASVSGYCAELGCRPGRAENQLPAYRRLSDHCPVVIELR